MLEGLLATAQCHQSRGMRWLLRPALPDGRLLFPLKPYAPGSPLAHHPSAHLILSP